MLPKQKAVEIIFPLEISIIIWDLREWCFFLPEKSNFSFFKAFIPLCTIFKFYHINGDKSLPRKLSPHVFKSNTKLQFQN
ncbi:hypothetical protein [Spiroplasma endosymbiont of Zeiraphera isertana]|uniref:hypothetical protein n=1 Tax=Spiroplasma endosymbiont of Zeiraphera isertana TaxID=3066313 RepID=UPI00313C2470